MNSYYWSIDYCNQNVFLQEIYDENEMISITRRKLADITGEQIVSLSLTYAGKTDGPHCRLQTRNPF